MQRVANLRYRSSIHTSLKILALRGTQGLRPIKPIIKLRVKMAGLKPQHGAVRGHVNRETPIPIEEVFAIGGGCCNGRLAHRLDLADHFVVPPPCASTLGAAANAFRPEFDFNDSPNRTGHGLELDSTKRLN